MDFWAWLASLFTPKPAQPVPVAPVSGTTVLTLAPAWFGLGTNWLRGEPFAGGNTVQPVNYPNTPGAANAAAGVNNLDAAMHANPGQLLVVGHSEGAQVIAKWLRENPNSDIDPARVEFVLTGNPERKGTGAMVSPNRPWWVVAAYGGPGFPADTRYRVRDLARVGDFFADFAHCTDQNTGMGVHNDYTQVSLDNATVDSVEGNVTYLSSP
jgi:hypothetical protein